MKKLIAATLILSSISAFADITIIKTQIHASEAVLEDNIVNIFNPTLSFKGERFPLEGSYATATYACKKLNMRYVDYSYANSQEEEKLFSMTRQGAISFINSSGKIGILTCEKIIKE